MIGWKCDYGYCLDGTGFPRHLDDITWTDKNSIFSIQTIPSSIEYQEVTGTDDLAYSALESWIGEGVNSYYSVPRPFRSYEVAIEAIKIWLPSIQKAAPVLYNVCQSTIYSSANPSVIYIPSLKRVILTRRTSNSAFSTAVLEVSSSGSLSNISNGYQYGFGITYYIASGSGGYYAGACTGAIRGYHDNIDLSDSTNWGFLRFGFSTTVNLWITNFIKSNDYDNIIISALFSDNNIPPDFEVIPPVNPYEPGGPSGPTDPSIPPGSFDDSSDAIPDSSMPTLSSSDTGFTRIYNPTLSQVKSLAQYLWTTEDVIQTIWNHIGQFFANPMDALIGFNLVPVPVPNGGQETFKLMFIDTGVTMITAASQFVDVDCGTVEVKYYYGSALDHSPFTKVSCFLPFIGTVVLNTDEVMGTTLQCKYRVDIASGSCVAKILIDGNCLYQFSGHCAINIPFSSADFSSYISAAISVGKLAAAALTAGASAAAAASVEEVAQQTNQIVTTTDITTTARNPATGRQITTGTTRMVETREAPADQSSTQASFSGLSPQNVANTVGQIMSSKPYIEHSGSFSGNSGYLGVRRPFLIIERPNMCMPENYQALNGFPSMITLDLATCKGFTRVQQVQLTGLGATNPEQAEIMEFLKNGVIL